MDQQTIPEDEVVFRLPANLGRIMSRLALVMAFAVPVIGGLALMGDDAPILNSMGLVMVLVTLMVWVARLVSRKKTAPRRHARKHRGQVLAAAVSTGSRTLVQDLALLAALHSRGQITDAEFASIKAKLLEG